MSFLTLFDPPLQPTVDELNNNNHNLNASISLSLILSTSTPLIDTAGPLRRDSILLHNSDCSFDLVNDHISFLHDPDFFQDSADDSLDTIKLNSPTEAQENNLQHVPPSVTQLAWPPQHAFTTKKRYSLGGASSPPSKYPYLSNSPRHNKSKSASTPASPVPEVPCPVFTSFAPKDDSGTLVQTSSPALAAVPGLRLFKKASSSNTKLDSPRPVSTASVSSSNETMETAQEQPSVKKTQRPILAKEAALSRNSSLNSTSSKSKITAPATLPTAVSRAASTRSTLSSVRSNSIRSVRSNSIRSVRSTVSQQNDGKIQRSTSSLSLESTDSAKRLPAKMQAAVSSVSGLKPPTRYGTVSSGLPRQISTSSFSSTTSSRSKLSTNPRT